MRKSKKYREYESELIESHRRYVYLRECGNADHLNDKNGNFISSSPRGEGTVSIGYLEDACQWLFYRKDLDDEDRLRRILIIEGIIVKLLNGINYIPYWSPKVNVTKEEK